MTQWYRNISSHDRIRDGDTPMPLWNSPALPESLALSPSFDLNCEMSEPKLQRIPSPKVSKHNNIIETSISLHSSWLGSLHASSQRVFHELSHNSHVQRVLRLPFSRSRPHAAEPSTFHRWERQAAPLKMSVVNIGIRDPMCHWLDVGVKSRKLTWDDVGTDVAKHGAYMFLFSTIQIRCFNSGFSFNMFPMVSVNMFNRFQECAMILLLSHRRPCRSLTCLWCTAPCH